MTIITGAMATKDGMREMNTTSTETGETGSEAVRGTETEGGRGGGVMTAIMTRY